MVYTKLLGTLVAKRVLYNSRNMFMKSFKKCSNTFNTVLRILERLAEVSWALQF